KADVRAGLHPVRGDPSQLYQVLLNLCVNARDAMPDGGTLAIAAAAVRVDPAEAAGHPDARPGDYVRLEVADTGTGIPADVLDRVFDPFFTTKKAGHGTGLGLSTVLGIVRSHGGFLTMASTPGAGTRFAVYWPIADAPAAAPAATESPALPTRSASGLVLVVDDEAPILHAARATLEGAGYQVASARDGRAAIDLYRAAGLAVTAVVLDVMMPEMDGGATLAELRKLDPACRVLLTSGLRLPAPLAAATRDGGVGFLAKPYSGDQLLTAVGALTGSAV
ncbi:MAG TPA: ATP-binding protein, partial [Gemmataceae bacterium]|nr:ATP-binding protein [Gemmataceae bacterium]